MVSNQIVINCFLLLSIFVWNRVLHISVQPIWSILWIISNFTCTKLLVYIFVGENYTVCIYQIMFIIRSKFHGMELRKGWNTIHLRRRDYNGIQSLSNTYATIHLWMMKTTRGILKLTKYSIYLPSYYPQLLLGIQYSRGCKRSFFDSQNPDLQCIT